MKILLDDLKIKVDISMHYDNKSTMSIVNNNMMDQIH